MPRASRILPIALVLAVGMTGYFWGMLIPRVRSVLAAEHLGAGSFYGNDFYPIWFTAQRLPQDHANPYSDHYTREIEKGIYGRPLVPALPGDPPKQYRGFSYPLYITLFAWPLAGVSFPQTQVLLTVLFIPLIAWAAHMWLRVAGVALNPAGVTVYLLFYLTSSPALEALFALQPSILVMACLAGMALGLVQGRYFLAGICLALASIKPQITLLLTVWLLGWSLLDWGHRKRLALGFGLTITVLLGLSEWVFAGWILAFLHALAAYREFTVPTLTRVMFGRWFSAPVAAILLLLVVRQCWGTRRLSPEPEDFQITLALVLAVTLLLFPTAMAVYDHLLLVPGWLWICKHWTTVMERRPRRWLVYLLAGALLWQWSAATIVAVLAFLVPGLRSNSSLVLAPLHLQITIPFISTAILALAATRRTWVETTRRAVVGTPSP